MNKQLYRVIFSKALGTFIAVAETTAAQGKRNGNSASAKQTFPLMRFATLSVVVAALFGQVSLAQAQMVAYKNGAAPRPIMDQSANGRPIVQIVNPNAAGLSHNKYDQFNVDSNGVILNNSPTNVSTQLGGYIQGNPQINRPANIILNEVMSTSRSQLNGYIEVAGQRAEVIVANPNGISIGNGAGFINTTRGVLTTGVPTFGGDGSLAGFRVTKGDITIGAGGMNATGADQLDLIGRSIKVNDAIWANGLNLVAGANQVDYRNLGVTLIAGEGDQPTVAIDSAALGGMYAQKILLVGTDKGVGVNIQGDLIATAGDITMDNSGKIALNGKTNASGNVALRADDDISNTGTLYGQQAVTITSDGQVTNSGTLAAGKDLTINAASINSSGLLASGIDANGQATQHGNLTLTARGQITSTGQHIVGGDLAMTGTNLDLSNSQTGVNGNVNLNATAGNIDLSNAKLTAGGDTTISTSGAVDNDGGSIVTEGDLNLAAATLLGEGTILAGNDATLALQGNYTHTVGNHISANNTLNFGVTGDFINQGILQSGKALHLTANNITNETGGLMNSGFTHLFAKNLLWNQGRIYGDNVAIAARSMLNENGGVIASRNTLNIGTNSLTNWEHGRIMSVGDMVIGGALDDNYQATGKALSIVNGSSTIDAGGNLTINAANLNNINNHFTTDTELVSEEVITDYSFDMVNWYTREQGADEYEYDGDYNRLRLNGRDEAVYYIRQYINTVTKTIVTGSDPSQIVANGNIQLNVDSVNNFASVIVAGLGLSGGGEELHNNTPQGIIRTTMLGDASQAMGIRRHYIEECGWGLNKQTCNRHTAYDTYSAQAPDKPLPLTIWPNGQPDRIANPSKGQETGDTPLPGGETIKLPTDQLFIIHPEPDQHYLIETDPAFTNYGQFMSSDYMMQRLGMDPAGRLKRLGDGYYEQKLMQDQILQLTGKRFLGGYTNNQDQFQALMDNGVQTAQQLQLTPGTALTSDQVAALTTDMMWLVKQTVTLSDGTKQEVLAPVIYLAKGNADNLAPTGGLIAAQTMGLDYHQVQNTGTLQASKQLVVNANDITNSGTIQSKNKDGTGTVVLAATNDLTSNGAINANRAGLSAGRDVTIESSTGTATSRSGNQTGITRVASIEADTLAIQSGRDTTINAAAITTKGDAQIVAGNNLNIGTKTTSETIQADWGGQGYAKANSSQTIGSQINTGGNLTLVAGQDINATASTINAEQALTAAAGRDVNVSSGVQQSSHNNYSHVETNGFLFSGTTDITDIGNGQQVMGSNLTGGSITIVSGRDTTVQGSQAIAKNDVVINAGRDLNVISAQNSSQNSYAMEETKSGLSASLMNGISYGSSAQDQSQHTTSTQQVGSVISGANVRTVSGRDATITASAITADTDIGIYAGRDINVMAATEQQTQQSDSHSSSTSIGLMGGLNGGRFTMFSQNDSSQNDTGNATTQSTSLISANGGTLNLQAGLDDQYKGTGKGNVATQGAELLAKNPLNIGGNAVDLQEVQNASNSRSHSETSSVTLGASLTGTMGSAITRVGDMATEAQHTSNDRLKGALALKAGYDAYKLIDGGKISQTAAESLEPNPQAQGDGFGVSVSLGVSQSEQDSNNRATQSRGTTAQASEINITAREGDITMTGAKLQAKDIALDAAKNINLLAAQNTADLHSTNSGSSAGIGVTLGANGQQNGISFQIGASMSDGHANGSEVTYDNTQITATNGLKIKSGGDTNLIGAQLAADKVQADIGGNLNIVTLQDKNNYESQQENGGFSLSICIPPLCYGLPAGSVNYAQQTIDHHYQSATGQSGIAAGSGGFDIKVGGNTDLQGAAITSTADAAKNVFQTASLTSRDLINTDKTKSDSVSISVSTASVISNVIANGLGNLNGGAGLPEDSDQRSNTVSVISPSKIILTGTGDITKDAQSKATADELTTRDASTANGALTNTLTLQQAQGLQAAQQEAMENQRAASLAGAAMASMVGDIAQHAGWKDGSPQKIAMHGIVGLIEAKMGGTSAAAGLIAGMSVEAMSPVLSEYLLNNGYSNDPRNKEAFKEYNDMMKLGATLVGTAAGAVAGGSTQNAGAGGNIGLTADTNNRQLHPDEKQRIKQLANGDPAKEARLTAAACAAVQCYAEYPVDSEAYKQLKQLADMGSSPDLAGERQQLANQGSLFNYTTNGLLSDSNIDATKQFNNNYKIVDRGLGAGQLVLGGAGLASSVISAPALCLTGVGCVASAVAGTMSFDAAYAGAQQLVSGNLTNTFMNQGLQGLGLSPEAAGLVELALGGGAAITATSGINKAFDQATALNGAARVTYGTGEKELPLLRQQYVNAVDGLTENAAAMRAKGASVEEVARFLHTERNNLKLQYRDLSPTESVTQFEQRNIQKYGNPVGPTIEQLRSQGKSWEQIIESASRPGGKDLGY